MAISRSIANELGFRVLAESTRYILGNLYETVFVINKIDGSSFQAGEHYGDPICGLISPNDIWFITGGEGLLCFSIENTTKTFFRGGFPPIETASSAVYWSIDSMFAESPTLIALAVEQSDQAVSIWYLDLTSMSVSPSRNQSK